MKKILFILVAFMLSIFASSQTDEISRKMGSNDSLSVTVKFEKVKLSKEESTVQTQINALLTNSVNTNEQLAKSINRLTDAVEQGISVGKLTKADIVAEQMGVDKNALNKAFKANNRIILISLIPALLFIFYAMGSFLMQKGTEIKHLLAGTAVMALYALIGSGVLYSVLSLLFNSKYFIIKDLMSALF